MNYRGVRGLVIGMSVLFSFIAPPSAAEAENAALGQAEAAPADAEVQVAPVEIDGYVLFRVRGSSSFPAQARADAIAARIKAVAADRTMSVDAVDAVESEFGSGIFAGTKRLMVVQDIDASMESVPRPALAHAFVTVIRKAIVDYRQARSPEAVTHSLISGGVATVIFAVLLVIALMLSRRLRTSIERRFRERIHSLQIQSFQIVRREHIWRAAMRAADGVRAMVVLLMGFLYLGYMLALFPWTRGLSNHMLDYVINPLASMGQSLLREIPDLILLTILFFITRYALKLIHLFFGAVGRGEVAFSGFERDWSEPTYKLIRVGIICFAIVVAFPYIPGSGSDAFKGISLLIGIVFSLGSSSAIGNIIAGYMLTYRRVFKLGDRVKIGEMVGDVMETRVQVTHLKTVKNEEVIIPNSTILNNEVINFTTLSRTEGLILHMTVGIGYETPWRQVEAMLLMAADRTPGLLKEPLPFVRLQDLGDFAVTYEVNAYCNNAQAMVALYTELRRQILDLFNEYGVQIMTPAYENDPEAPKLVPKDQWFSAPAKPANQK